MEARLAAQAAAPGSQPRAAVQQAQAPAALDAPVTLLALPAPEAVVSQMVTMTVPDAFFYEPALALGGMGVPPVVRPKA